jgi:NOL1/NOP2/fmu family ribosome biogenesis protein
LKGEGFFLACFKKESGDDFTSNIREKDLLPRAGRNELTIVEPFLHENSSVEIVKWKEEILLLPPSVRSALPLLQTLYVKKAGVEAGRIVHGGFIPAHALAQSTLMNGGFVAVSLKREDALQYLRRQEVRIETSSKGWLLVQYQGINLGWIKALGNRINNYYPREWRILKSGNN